MGNHSSPGDLPDSGIEPTSPALPGEFFTTEPQGSPRKADEPDCSSLCPGLAWPLGRVSGLSCTFLCKTAYMLWTQENLALNPSMAVRCFCFLIFKMGVVLLTSRAPHRDELREEVPECPGFQRESRRSEFEECRNVPSNLAQGRWSSRLRSPCQLCSLA